MIKRMLIVLSMLALPLFSAAPVSAVCSPGVAGFLLLEPWHSCLPKDAGGKPKINELNDVWKIVIVLLDGAVKIVGYVAVALVIFGGIKFITSRGEPGSVASARTTILNAIIGLALAMLAVAIVQLVAGSFR